MKTIETTVCRVNGQFDRFASENTVRVQSYASLASEHGKSWSDMSARQKANFRRRHSGDLKDIETTVEVFHVTAVVPEIFHEFQVKEAAIHALILNSSTLFVECKNGTSGWETSNFSIIKQ
jgi:hypothetical protein